MTSYNNNQSNNYQNSQQYSHIQQLQNSNSIQHNNNQHNNDSIKHNNDSIKHNNDFIKHNNNQQSNTSNNKTSFQLQLSQLQSKLFHQIILKSQLSNQSDFDKQIIKKLSSSIKQSLSDNLQEIQTLIQKLSNPLLNLYQKQQIKQQILSLKMQQLANTKVLINTYRHHQYRLVISLLHISQSYQQLKCYDQSINHLENAISINDSYRHITKDVQYFHSSLLTYLGLAQYQVQNYNISLQNLNKALEIHQSLKNQHYQQCHDFFSLNLITKVLLAAGKKQQSISFAKMALQSAKNDYSEQSIQYAQSCKTLAQSLASSNQFQSALQYLHQAIHAIQVNHPDKQQTMIQYHQKLAQIKLKKLNTLKPQQPSNNYFDQYLQVIKNKYTVIENTYGYRDKRVIKEKRHLASALLKYGKILQSQQELQDILEIQEVVYGQKSVEVAKTLKLLGTVAMSLNQSAKAQKHLKKSMGIFHDQGQFNLQKQAQAKLMILTGKGKFLINTKP